MEDIIRRITVPDGFVLSIEKGDGEIELLLEWEPQNFTMCTTISEGTTAEELMSTISELAAALFLTVWEEACCLDGQTSARVIH